MVISQRAWVAVVSFPNSRRSMPDSNRDSRHGAVRFAFGSHDDTAIPGTLAVLKILVPLVQDREVLVSVIQARAQREDEFSEHYLARHCILPITRPVKPSCELLEHMAMQFESLVHLFVSTHATGGHLAPCFL